jgi:prepilin-type N-terminal cleavage/methylation domain-containing protein
MNQGLERSFGSERGLSLIEVLFAAVILGIAVVTFSYLFGTAGADIVQLGNERVCLQVAHQEMEDLLNLPYDDTFLTAGRHYRRFKRPPADVKSPELDGELFVEWQVTYFDDPYGTGQDYKRIVLELYDDFLDDDPDWVGSDPAVNEPVERVITLTTFIAP